MLTAKTKKYPYTKSEKVTTTEMKKTKKSTVGVLPNHRQTTDIQELNLLMEGQPPKSLKSESDHLIDMVKGANTEGNYHGWLIG